jgi:hypothetical protein
MALSYTTCLRSPSTVSSKASALSEDLIAALPTTAASESCRAHWQRCLLMPGGATLVYPSLGRSTASYVNNNRHKVSYSLL